MCRAGQNRIYSPYITDFPAENTVYTPYTYRILANLTYVCMYWRASAWVYEAIACTKLSLSDTK